MVEAAAGAAVEAGVFAIVGGGSGCARALKPVSVFVREAVVAGGAAGVDGGAAETTEGEIVFVTET